MIVPGVRLAGIVFLGAGIGCDGTVGRADKKWHVLQNVRSRKCSSSRNCSELPGLMPAVALALEASVRIATAVYGAHTAQFASQRRPIGLDDG